MNRKQQKFSQALGFDARGTYRMDDTWLDDRTFVNNLEEMLADKLYNHD